MSWEPTTHDENVARLRDDFMRRWFAIALSVGFATTVANMEWVKSGSWPNIAEQNQLMRLSVAVVATVLSWEGYLQSISTKKLYDIYRFLIDVFLVFAYLFLLITSRFHQFWLFLHAATFSVYVVWDALTVAQYNEQGWFKGSKEKAPSWGAIYPRSLLSAEHANRGPIITVIWCAYFWYIWWQSLARPHLPTMLFAAFVLSGLAGYRLDKGKFRSKAWFSPLSTITLSLLLYIFICA